jgi:hypothetical protein
MAELSPRQVRTSFDGGPTSSQAHLFARKGMTVVA